jgi:hypothetical protein
LILQLCRNRQIGPAIGDSILIKRDSSRQRLDRIRNVLMVPSRVRGSPGDLTYFDPQLGLLDIRRGFVVAGQEAYGGIRVPCFGGRV